MTAALLIILLLAIIAFLVWLLLQSGQTANHATEAAVLLAQQSQTDQRIITGLLIALVMITTLAAIVMFAMWLRVRRAQRRPLASYTDLPLQQRMQRSLSPQQGNPLETLIHLEALRMMRELRQDQPLPPPEEEEWGW